MRLANPEALARDIETGLGEVHPSLRRRLPELRLRDSVCGLVSIALKEAFCSAGLQADLIHSYPNLEVDPEMSHVFPVVTSGDTQTIIDATFTQFLSYSGLVPGYVIYGGKNVYPKEKIAVFPIGEEQETVNLLADTAHTFLSDREYIEELSWKKSWPFDGMSRDAIAGILACIWDPKNFQQFNPDPDTLEAGQYVSRFIDPKHTECIV